MKKHWCRRFGKAGTWRATEELAVRLGAALALALAILPARAQTTITFEEFAAGTLVSELYSPQGVHFMNDYRAVGGYRAAPGIVMNANSPSPTRVLLNYAQDCEIINSFNAPLVFWFDQRKASVSMFLGTTQDPGGAPCSCGGPYPARVSFRDCTGTLIAQITTNVSTAFNTFVQFSDPQRRIRRVDVDYLNTSCLEAIDNLSFTAGTGNCTDTTPPVITITSHTNDQLVIEAQQYIYGTVTEPGILRFVYVNGFQTTFRLESSGQYSFDGSVFLQEGNNTITFLAENASGLRGSTQLRLFLGTPVSATLNSFHLTQRGVMLDQACDIDTPLVAGKTAVVRVGMDVRTASGMPTYASSVRLNVWRKINNAPDTLVGTFYGNTYAPFLSTLNSPSDLAAVHFWLPGFDHAFDVAGDYRFTLEAYVGNALIGTPQRPCGSQYVTFQETKPVRLLVLPVERGRNDPLWSGTPHYANFYLQLDTIARAYPVRDGVGLFGSNRGLIFYETSPLFLCDGPNTAGLDHCEGTDWTWDFIEHHPSGLLRRGIDATVRDPMIPNLCDPNNTIIGGRITTNATATFSYNPALGIYRIEPIPEWPKGKHVTPQDEDHDGDVDAADIAFYAAEFFDTGTGTWTTDFGRYDQGEVFRYFRDQNGNSCFDGGEPQSLVRQRGINERTLLWDPAQKALDQINGNIPGTANDFRSASLWFPDPLIPPVQFGASGPGQGNKPGRLSWIRVMNIVAMAHELGHNFDLPDLYLDNIPDDLRSIENAWAVYINGQSKPPNQVFEIMAVSQSPDSEAFSKAHYQKIFDQLKVTSSFAAPEGSPAPEGVNDQFVISGIIYDDDGHVDKVATSLGSGMMITPAVPGSRYTLVFGQGNTTLSTLPFAPDPQPDGHGGGQNEFIHYQSFHVVADFPPASQWVEVRIDNQPQARINRSVAAPVVTVLAPNGGESSGAAETVNIRWTATDADSIGLRSSVYYSPDNGSNWMLLAAALRQNSMNWNTATWPGSSNGLIRVVTCDGFNTGQDQSNARFSVATKPPRVVILEPRDGQVILQCARPIVRGLAEDIDGAINSVLWSVDSNRVTARAEAQLAPLTPGPHVLRFEAFDTSGQMGFQEITVQVQADSDCDGMSDAYEEAHGLNPGSGNDAMGDSDADGVINFDEAVYGTDPTNSDTDNDLYPDGMEIGARSDPLNPLDTPFTTGLFSNALYVNCGPTFVTDTLGRLWRPDGPFLVTSNSNLAPFTGFVDTSLLSDQFVPQDVLLYERWKDGHLNYRIPAPPGFYSVVFYFAENCRACVNTNLGGTGPAGAARIFDVQVEARRTNNYNQADAAVPPPNDGRGATFKATQMVFRDVPVNDGILNLDILDRGTGNPPENAAVKGMAIIQQTSAGALAPTHVVWIGRVETFLRLRVDPGANRAAYYAGLTQLELQQSTDLTTWTLASLPVGTEGNNVIFETPFNGPARFYRIAARLTNL